MQIIQAQPKSNSARASLPKLKPWFQNCAPAPNFAFVRFYPQNSSRAFENCAAAQLNKRLNRNSPDLGSLGKTVRDAYRSKIARRFKIEESEIKARFFASDSSNLL
jgi:hypothetical protein